MSLPRGFVTVVFLDLKDTLMSIFLSELSYTTTQLQESIKLHHVQMCLCPLCTQNRALRGEKSSI
jgi:hypothetical protein